MEPLLGADEEIEDVLRDARALRVRLAGMQAATPEERELERVLGGVIDYVSSDAAYLAMGWPDEHLMQLTEASASVLFVCDAALQLAERMSILAVRRIRHAGILRRQAHRAETVRQGIERAPAVQTVAELLTRAGWSTRLGGTDQFPCIRVSAGPVSWTIGPVGQAEWGWDRVAPKGITSGTLNCGPAPGSVAQAVLGLLGRESSIDHC